MATDAEILSALRDAYYAKVTGGAVLGYSINGRSVQHMSLTELLAQIRYFKAQTTPGGATNFAEFERIDGA